MITKPKASKFRIRRATPLPARAAGESVVHPVGPTGAKDQTRDSAADFSAMMVPPPGMPGMTGAVDSPAMVDGEQDMDQIRQEGLTGRQLRMARRVAQKHGLAVTSDFDAVRQLRAQGVDPFQRSNILELVVPGQAAPGLAEAGGKEQQKALPGGRIQLPQTVPQGPRNLPSTDRSVSADKRVGEIMKIQRDIMRRRRKKVALLFSRLAVFVFAPTILVGWYFFVMATPMFATNSEFVIQQAESTGAAAGLGGLFQGTSMATQQDSITVQSYLASRAALQRLDEEHGFKAHFSADSVDPIQRLPADATNEDAYSVYQNHVVIKYDPTEGILRMEVIATDPATSQRFSEALISYAEEQVDQLTQRPREDQMRVARTNYDAAEARRSEALAAWLQIQQDVQQIDPIGETSARTAQISALETERQQLQLSLQERLGVTRPNEAQVNALRSQIASIENLINDLRSEMTAATETGTSLASKNTELRLAEENYTFQTLMVQAALQQMESAQIEANRQVRYLSMGVEPVAPDEATYPRAFENTAVAFLIFAGIYLMLSLTASILREQVTS